MLNFFPKPFRSFRIPAADKEFYLNLRKILGFSPDDLDVYKLALIHRSASVTLSQGQKVDNERLEYLGDAILDAIVADYLFEAFPNSDEGFLTKMRSRIVSRSSMNQLAISMGIPNVVKVSNGALYQQKYIYGNALEAIVGAMFIDKGFKFTSEVVVNNILRRYIDLNELQTTEHDYKSRLLELAQKQHVNVAFNTREVSEEKQTPTFASALTWNGIEIATGTGHSKKEAEQQAAMQGMIALEKELNNFSGEDSKNLENRE